MQEDVELRKAETRSMDRQMTMHRRLQLLETARNIAGKSATLEHVMDVARKLDAFVENG